MVTEHLYLWADLTKAIVPAHEVYWGYPGEVPPVMEQLVMTPNSEVAGTGAASSMSGCLHLVLRQYIVSRTEPISVSSQILEAASFAGGGLALMSSAFFVLFTKKNKPTQDEMKSQELTLRGLMARRGPAKDEYVALA